MPLASFNFDNRAFLARWPAALTAVLAVASLCGWIFHLPPLTSVIPGAVEMKFNTAIALLLCSLALLILNGTRRAARDALAITFGVLVFALGLATLFEYILDADLKIDQWLVPDTAGAYDVFRGRMSPGSAVAFVCSGIAVATLTTGRLSILSRSAAIATAAVGMISLLGYLWNIGEIITDQVLPPVAINTAVGFICIGASILLTPRRQATTAASLATPSLATLELKIAFGFCFAMSLLVAGGSFTYRNSVEFGNAVAWVSHGQEVRTTLANIVASLAAADVAARDFLLTRDRHRSDDYRQLRERVTETAARLRSLVADNSEQHEQALALQRGVEERLAALDAVLKADQDFGLPAARAVLTVSYQSIPLTRITTLVEEMDTVEVRLLASRQSASVRVRYGTLISLLVTLAIASMLFTALLRAIHREMVGRRGAEEGLRSSDSYNRSIIESSPDCLAVLTTDAQITQMTPQGQRLMDIGDFALIAGTDWCDLWHGPYREAAQHAVDAARNGRESRFEGLSPTRSGVEKWWDVIVMPIKSTHGATERLLAVARDITAVKRTEANLVSTNRFLDSLIDNLPVIIEVKDAKTLRLVRVNRAAEQFMGVTRGDMIGRLAGEIAGEHDAPSDPADRLAVETGTLVDVPERDVVTPLQGVKKVHAMTLPILGTDGRAQFVLSMMLDITQRKLAEQAILALNGELQAKAAELEATNKELESFSYSVSHDLRAPLRAIDGFAEIIEEEYKVKLDAEGLRYLAVIRENSKRMGALIDDLLAFSRLGRQAVSSSAINVESLVREVVDEVLVSEAINLGSRSPPPQVSISPLPPAYGDRNLLRQVWCNLISNAVKYSSKSAAPRIEITAHEAANECQYSVRDNGVGFSMKYAHQLFGVFQRLHRADEFRGTGVGLAIVQRVITRHGGRVWAEGAVGAGATFSFALPKGVVVGE